MDSLIALLDHLLKQNIEIIQQLMQTEDTNHISRNDLDNACFQHDMAYGKYKELAKGTQSVKVLRDNAFEIANNLKNDGYQWISFNGFQVF